MKRGKYIILARSIVFSSLVVAGVATFAIVAIFHVNWFYPYVAFGLTVFFAWQKFFIDEPPNQENDQKPPLDKLSSENKSANMSRRTIRRKKSSEEDKKLTE